VANYNENRAFRHKPATEGGHNASLFQRLTNRIRYLADQWNFAADQWNFAADQRIKAIYQSKADSGGTIGVTALNGCFSSDARAYVRIARMTEHQDPNRTGGIRATRGHTYSRAG
jgi:hypothetical protein